MNLNISYELKLEILNSVRKRNLMFAKWIDLCSTIAFIIVAILALINATSLGANIFGKDVLDIVTVVTVIMSICFDFIFKSDKYKENIYLINDVLKKSVSQVDFNQAFVELIPLIDELDIARARNDYCKKLKTINKLNTQKDEDKLQPVDLITMDRQRYCIIVLLLEVLLFIGMLIAMANYPMLLYFILFIMIFVGVLFMIIDAGGEKRAIKQVEEIYKENV